MRDRIRTCLVAAVSRLDLGTAVPTLKGAALRPDDAREVVFQTLLRLGWKEAT
jgi:hypothetical protein